MRRIALCLYAAVLLLPLVSCKKEETKTEPAKAPATDSATPPADGGK